jgi:hypothetical protein
LDVGLKESDKDFANKCDLSYSKARSRHVFRVKLYKDKDAVFNKVYKQLNVISRE